LWPTCPNGWSDWQAAIEQVAAAGKAIGIDITTNYPDWSVYQTVFTSWKAVSTNQRAMISSCGRSTVLARPQPWSAAMVSDELC